MFWLIFWARLADSRVKMASLGLEEGFEIPNFGLFLANFLPKKLQKSTLSKTSAKIILGNDRRNLNMAYFGLLSPIWAPLRVVKLEFRGSKT